MYWLCYFFLRWPTISFPNREISFREEGGETAGLTSGFLFSIPKVVAWVFLDVMLLAMIPVALTPWSSMARGAVGVEPFAVDCFSFQIGL